MVKLSNYSKERWICINGFDNKYKINPNGKILNTETGKLVKFSTTESGYVRGNLKTKSGKKSRPRMHRLLATAFIKNPNNYSLVNHINNNKEDNRIENLEWCTALHNAKEWIKIGRGKRKITKTELDIMYEMSKKYNLEYIANHFNLNRSIIHVLLKFVHPEY